MFKRRNAVKRSTMFRDSEYDSNYSDGMPYFRLKDEVMRGNYDAVRQGLDDGWSPNETDDEHGKYTLLHWSAAMTDEESLDEINGQQFHVEIGVRRQIVQLSSVERSRGLACLVARRF